MVHDMITLIEYAIYSISVKQLGANSNVTLLIISPANMNNVLSKDNWYFLIKSFNSWRHPCTSPTIAIYKLYVYLNKYQAQYYY